MIISITLLCNLEIHHNDVKLLSLNRYLDEEIYVDQLESCIATKQERKVCNWSYCFMILTKGYDNGLRNFDTIKMSIIF